MDFQITAKNAQMNTKENGKNHQQLALQNVQIIGKKSICDLKEEIVTIMKK